MNKSKKKPSDISQEDWDSVNSPELGPKFFGNARPVREAHPELAAWSAKRKRGQRGAQKAPTKKPVTLRLDVDILNAFKSTGRGYQTRMAEALRKASPKTGKVALKAS